MRNRRILIAVLLTMSIIHGFSASEKSLLTVTPTQIGPIKQDTPYNQLTLQKLLTDFTVKQGNSMTEGESFPVLLVYHQKNLLLTIVPDDFFGNAEKIFCISFVSPNMMSHSGIKVGAYFSDVYKKNSKLDCVPGLEEMSGLVVCRAPESAHLIYVFGGNYDGPDGIPPAEILEHWQIKQITWIPDASAPLQLQQYCRAVDLRR